MNGALAALSHSQEQYLRTIYELSAVKPLVYQRDVVQKLGCSKPSVCRAAALLRKKGLLEPDRRELVLTAEALALERRLHRAREQMQAALEHMDILQGVEPAGMEELARLLGEERRLPPGLEARNER